jgi:1-acyl-sn-glycerol-3-phosphate acyltransferase
VTVTEMPLDRSELWRPRSACGPACRSDDDDAVPAATAASRVAVLFGVLLIAALLVPVVVVLRGAARAVVVRTVARGMLAALGVRVQLRGRPPRPGSLLIANHVSWLDVIVLLAITPARLVAKREVRGWPAIGAMAAAIGAVFVDRSRPMALPHTVAEVAAALRSGMSVAVFPEGTTYCGVDQGPFRPAMFQAAVDAGAPVVPVTVAYRAAERDTRAAAFLGDDTLWDSVRRVAGVRGLTVSLVVSSALHPTAGADRRVLARAAQSTVRMVVSQKTFR